MESLIEFLNLAGGRFVSFAWPMLWQSTAVILGVWVLNLLLRRHASAAFRYTLSLLILVKFVMPPTLALPTSPFYWHSSASVTEERSANGADPLANDATQAPARSLPVDAGVATYSPSSALGEPAVTLTWAGLALLIVLGGQAILVVFLLFRLGQVHQLVRLATNAPPELKDLLEDCCRQLSLRRPVAIKLTNLSMSPALCGAWRPVILLPDHLFQSLDESQLRSVILHELVHHRRRDVWMNWAQTLLQILYWWHPLSWPANTHIRNVREQAVDESVVSMLKEESDSYASALLVVARQCLSRPMTSLGLVGIIESSKVLKDRIHHLLEAGPNRPSKLSFAGLLFVALFALTILPMAKAQLRSTDGVASINRTAPVSVLFYEIPETELLSLSLRQPDQRTGNVSVWSFNPLELETVLRRARTNEGFRGFTQTDVVGPKSLGGEFLYVLDPGQDREASLESAMRPQKDGTQLFVKAHAKMQPFNAPSGPAMRSVVYSGLYQTFGFTPQAIAGGYSLRSQWRIGKNDPGTALNLRIHADGGTLVAGPKNNPSGLRPVILLLTSLPFPKLDWADWSPAAVEQARRENQVVLVHFEAQWALASQVNLETALNTRNVRHLMQRVGGVALRADNTQANPAIRAELARHGRAGVPLTLIYPRQAGTAPIVLPEPLTETAVLTALTNAAKTEVAANPPRFRVTATAYEFPANSFQALAAGPKSPNAPSRFSTSVMPLSRKETLLDAIRSTSARELEHFVIVTTNGLPARMHNGGTLALVDDRGRTNRIEKGVLLEATPRLRPDSRLVELDVSIAHRKALPGTEVSPRPVLQAQSTTAATWLGTNQMMLVATPQEIQTLDGNLDFSADRPAPTAQPPKSESVLLVLLQVDRLDP